MEAHSGSREQKRLTLKQHMAHPAATRAQPEADEGHSGVKEAGNGADSAEILLS
jgi:hypothetical protein